ncbi:MAG: hypothetical protein LUD19_01620 [Clostridia bacterium]|nr:hypothetical protein [Clostridia bacterium]
MPSSDNFIAIDLFHIMRNDKPPIDCSPQKAEDALAREFSKTYIKNYTPKQAVKFVNKLFDGIKDN